MKSLNNKLILDKHKIIIGTALAWAGIHIITMVARSIKLGVGHVFTISPLSVLFCLGLCYALKKGAAEKLIATLLLINIAAVLLLFAYNSAGFKGPVIYLIAILPLMAFLLIDQKSGWIFSFLTISCFAIFAYLNVQAYPFPEPKLQGNALYIGRAVSISFLVFIISWVGWLYQKTYLQFIESIENKNKELITKDHYKSQFISHISHEFRTPLNAIIGFSKKLLSLKDQQESNREIEALKAINRGGKNLLNMVNNSLDLAQIESGELTCIKSPQNIRQLINETINDIEILAEQKKLTLLIHDSSYDELKINADPLKIKQVLNNLIANAIKYTEQGGITITLGKTTLGPQANHDFITIAISDTGSGIEANELDSLFSRFTRLKKHANSAIDGAGLGLSIAHELVKLHQGFIEVESRVNRGSCFTIFLPLINSKEL
ncbi:HAMP domain-containing histidine kinase [Dasania sp. GY-MA-18]|uniref:histidine kinase n=1 Tax=Dasania phycosphaerae TaxID=2950436 RepID=A0A9J6RKR3_9GAMM|nr:MULTISPECIES: HAMP domain-containing sensor histidine kinase [Dasania]MCR8922355.1 HAMP domain-containing histidine kinase [Dasania sp. GY-MA-18]MCZ0864783.1 HAMP domain-containing sensor histidine kinase [Dasania phycosphaerae]MCZ0868511.1 HAMP domain-containing sensor histidine kinase [Dasania phycosphaerae]